MYTQLVEMYERLGVLEREIEELGQRMSQTERFYQDLFMEDIKDLIELFDFMRKQKTAVQTTVESFKCYIRDGHYTYCELLRDVESLYTQLVDLLERAVADLNEKKNDVSGRNHVKLIEDQRKQKKEEHEELYRKFLETFWNQNETFQQLHKFAKNGQFLLEESRLAKHFCSLHEEADLEKCKEMVKMIYKKWSTDNYVNITRLDDEVNGTENRLSAKVAGLKFDDYDQGADANGSRVELSATCTANSYVAIECPDEFFTTYTIDGVTYAIDDLEIFVDCYNEVDLSASFDLHGDMLYADAEVEPYPEVETDPIVVYVDDSVPVEHVLEIMDCLSADIDQSLIENLCEEAVKEIQKEIEQEAVYYLEREATVDVEINVR